MNVVKLGMRLLGQEEAFAEVMEAEAEEQEERPLRRLALHLSEDEE